MIEQLEAEVRDALRARADEVPTAVGARLRQGSYRPRTGPSWPGLAASGAGVAGIAAAVIALAGPGSSTAFAGWSATPAALPNPQASAGEAACKAELRAEPMGPEHLFGGSGARAVLTDSRGPFTVVLFTEGNATGACFTAQHGTQIAAVPPPFAASAEAAPGRT